MPVDGQPLRRPTGFVATNLAVRWGSPRLFDEGFVGVPVTFLKRYARLGLSPGEAIFVLQLMSFKWTAQAPFPSYKKLATCMDITVEMARRHAKSLETKGLLRRIRRTGQTNVFDIAPLTTALETLLGDERRSVAA
jgi:hypothetical protein